MANRTIRVGIIEETLLVDIVKDGLVVVKECFRKYSNISLEFVFISKYEVAEMDLFATLPDNMEVLLFPFDYNLLVMYEHFNASRVSEMFLPTWTFILSPPPLAQTKSSLNFLNLETKVTWAFVISLITVSVFMSIVETSTKIVQKIRRHRRQRHFGFKLFIKNLKVYLWNNLLLFFFEPYGRTSSSNPWRIAFLSWLICVMVVNVEINSYLKSEFSETEYACINNTIELLTYQKAGVKFGIVQDGVEDRYVQKKSADDENFQKLFRILRDEREGELLSVETLVFGSVWTDVKEGRLILISGSMTVLASMTHEYYRFEDDKNLFDYKGIYFFSPPILSSYSALVYSDDFAKSPFADIFNQVLLINLECQLAKRIVMRTRFMTDFLSWKEPEVETTELSFTGAQSVIALYLIGNAISIAYFLIVYILNVFKRESKRKRIDKSDTGNPFEDRRV